MTRRRAITTTTIITALILAAASALFTYAPSLQPPAITPGYYAVTEVVDGDTIEVDMSGTREKIRMIGVDTPETKKPNAPIECYGPEASEFSKKMLGGKSVRLEADPTNDNRDRYGRLLRYVYLQDGSLYEEALIRGGYGFAYLSFSFQKSEEFGALHEQARTAKVGLWGACSPAESGGRWQSNAL